MSSPNGSGMDRRRFLGRASAAALAGFATLIRAPRVAALTASRRRGPQILPGTITCEPEDHCGACACAGDRYHCTGCNGRIDYHRCYTGHDCAPFSPGFC